MFLKDNASYYLYHQLLLAAKEGRLDVMVALLEDGGDVNYTDSVRLAMCRVCFNAAAFATITDVG